MRQVQVLLVVIAGVAALLLPACSSHTTSSDAIKSASPSPPATTPAPQAWANTDNGTIFATSDGVHWKKQSWSKGKGIYDVAFADSLHGWALSKGAILATTDGGATWQPQHQTLSDSLDGLACTDSKHAWVTGNDSKKRPIILGTADGGATWSQQYSGARDDYLWNIAFADSTHGWAITDPYGVLATSDGRHWHEQKSAARTAEPLNPYPGGVYFYGIACGDAKHVWIAGGYGAGAGNALILATKDGGETWKVQSSKLGGSFFGVAATDAMHAWVAWFGNSVLSTRNGGATWKVTTMRRMGRKLSLESVAFRDATHGWAVGDYMSQTIFKGAIVATSDGGKTWTKPKVVSGCSFRNVTCIKTPTKKPK